jgi:murein L,D-transpeptidase YcbB/YkuD
MTLEGLLLALPIFAAEPSLWSDAGGRPNADARAAIALLASAADDGLAPADYGAAELTAMAAALAAARPPPPAAGALAAFDDALTAGMLRYLRELHEGRLDPRAIGFRMTVPDDRHDWPALLRSAVESHRLGEAAAELAPPLGAYRALRGALRRYRELAADTTLVPLAPTRSTVEPGGEYPRVPALVRLLVALGDLAAEDAVAAGEGTTYDGPVVEAVRRFQVRHGLEPDGVLGRQTQEALAVPLSWRARQIELALERLRWLPHLDPQGLVAINIAMFRLWAWRGGSPEGGPQLATNVIVGRAVDRETPVFVDSIEQVIFRPYWNVPPSIARGEVLPALRRDAGYLRKHDMEIVAGAGDEAQRVGQTAENLAAVAAGRLRIRQRPGPRNALGLVKFVFPNDANVYLHDTPTRSLFRKPRRDFSHGCVRVEDPVGLAEWVLAGEEGWTRERILQAMNGERSQRVTLQRPIQVILFYVTALVVPEDGALRFAEDVYGHDARLDAALQARSRAGGPAAR